MNNISEIIHYCWFGGKEKPEIVLKCIESWKKYMPEYEIMEWNENNYDVFKIPFLKEAYECKKWAFVSDYVRFDVIDQYGGIYFDTDVELLKRIPDEILSQNAFTGFEYAGKVSPGLVYAASKNNPVTKEILHYYQNIHFVTDGKLVLTTVNTVITDILNTYGLVQNNMFQIVHGLSIYPSEFFCGYDQDVREVMISPNTVSVHHYAGTWTNKSLTKIIRNILKRILGIQSYRNLLKIKRMIMR